MGDNSTAIAIGVASGILLAVLVLVAGWWMITADDGLDCATENAQRAQDGVRLLDCD